MYREHPLKILAYASKSIWLLIFPLLRGLKTAHIDPDFFYNWIKGAWFDILVLLIILGYGYIRWFTTWIRFSEADISRSTTIIAKMETLIPMKNISAITEEHTMMLRPFKAVRIRIDTDGGVFNSSDMVLIMRKSDSRQLRHLKSTDNTGTKKSFEIRPKMISIIFFSFLFSNSISGMLFISAFFFQLGMASKDLLENELKTALDQLTGHVAAKFASSISPVAITLAIIIIITWLMSFVANIFRYSGFSMRKKYGIIKVRMGAVTRRQHHFVPKKINYVDMRQNLIMKLFKKTSLNISCSGYGKKKNQIPVLLPILSRRQANRALDILEFGKKIKKRSVKAFKFDVLTYLGYPLLFCIGIPLISSFITDIFPITRDFVQPFEIMFLIPSAWMAIVKLIALMTTGITIDRDFICIRYSRFFTFHTVLADRSKLVKIQIVQNPFQRIFKRCRLDFYFNCEQPKNNKLQSIRLSDAEKIIEVLSNHDTEQEGL